MYIEPTNANAGTYTIKVAAIDDFNPLAETTFQLVVTYNYPPVLTGSLQDIVMPTYYYSDVQIPSEAFFDPEGLPLSLELVAISLELPAFLNVAALLMRVQGIPTFVDIGDTKVAVRAVDNNA